MRQKLQRGIRWNGSTAYFEQFVAGGRKRKKLSNIRTRAEVATAYKDWVARLLNPPAPEPPPEETFESYTRKCWPISKKKTRPISENTAAREMYLLEARIFPALGALMFEQITATVVEEFAASLLAAKLKPATVNVNLALVHQDSFPPLP